MEKTVLCIRNQDMRQEYLAELMRESGYEVCLQEKIEGQKIETWDIILLPVVTGEVPFENICGHIRAGEYSCAMKSHFRKSGNQMSGKWKSSYASLLA